MNRLQETKHRLLRWFDEEKVVTILQAKKAEHEKMKQEQTTVWSEDHASDIFNAFETSMKTSEEEKNIILD